MLIIADEIILFTTLAAIALIWMVLKLLVHHASETLTPPRKTRPVKKAA